MTARVDRQPVTRHPGMARYRAVLAYEGTHYYGFQRQARNTPTIQGAVEDAFYRVTQQHITIIAAGRTDSGVHATGQVIAFDVDWRHSTGDLCSALNVTLPGDIALQSVQEAEAGFHPRFDALSRVYEYTLYTAPTRQPLLDRYAWHIRGDRWLDTEAIQTAAALLVGTFDFASFGQPPQGHNTVREVIRSELVMEPGLPAVSQFLRYTIEANAFLYRMVRRITGALMRVGRGDLTVQAFEAALRAADGSWPNQSAPARGLTLTKVIYQRSGETPAGVSGHHED